MIEAEGYTMNYAIKVRCDDKKHKGEELQEFFGETKDVCYKRLAESGWKTQKKGTFCPACLERILSKEQKEFERS